MKRSHMKRLKQCFGKESKFYKEKVKECRRCSFKKKCLLEIKGGEKE